MVSSATLSKWTAQSILPIEKATCSIPLLGRHVLHDQLRAPFFSDYSANSNSIPINAVMLANEIFILLRGIYIRIEPKKSALGHGCTQNNNWVHVYTLRMQLELHVVL